VKASKKKRRKKCIRMKKDFVKMVLGEEIGMELVLCLMGRALTRNFMGK
jgi:hypothetical protein